MKGNWNRLLLTSLEEVLCMPEGAVLGGESRVQAESTEAGPGTHAFIRVCN